MLNKDEQNRYSRHIILDEVGEKGQENLKKGSVLIVGLGGLGAPAATYLTGAGVGRIGLIDDDIVSLSNLQRQVLYSTEDIGKIKVECAFQILQEQNPNIEFDIFRERLSKDNAKDIISNYDVVVIAVDNAEARHAADIACSELKKPMIHGSISAYEGQVAFLNGGDCKSYNDVFPDVSDLQYEVNGVFIALPAIIGSIQANEVVKYFTKTGTLLKNQLLIYKALTNELVKLNL